MTSKESDKEYRVLGGCKAKIESQIPPVWNLTLKKVVKILNPEVLTLSLALFEIKIQKFGILGLFEKFQS